MSSSRIVCALSAVMLIAASAAWACDKDKAAATTAANGACTAGMAATAANGACTASMAATCTAGMAAACKAHMQASGATAATASSHACCAKGAATTAAKGRTLNVMAAAGGHCDGGGMAGMATADLHDDCEACLDMANASERLDAAGAHRQTVRLKNGVMLVYTADSPAHVSAVQAAIASRNEHLAHYVAVGDKVRLCNGCKAIRGAIASGKLNREVVNIQGGVLTLLTSSDPAIVTKIHEMTDQKVAARLKS